MIGKNWRLAKIDDGQKVTSELLEGIIYLKALLNKVNKSEKEFLEHGIGLFNNGEFYDEAISLAKSQELHDLFVGFDWCYVEWSVGNKLLLQQ